MTPSEAFSATVSTLPWRDLRPHPALLYPFPQSWILYLASRAVALSRLRHTMLSVHSPLASMETGMRNPSAGRSTMRLSLCPGTQLLRPSRTAAHLRNTLTICMHVRRCAEMALPGIWPLLSACPACCLRALCSGNHGSHKAHRTSWQRVSYYPVNHSSHSRAAP